MKLQQIAQERKMDDTYINWGVPRAKHDGPWSAIEFGTYERCGLCFEVLGCDFVSHINQRGNKHTMAKIPQDVCCNQCLSQVGSGWGWVEVVILPTELEA